MTDTAAAPAPASESRRPGSRGIVLSAVAIALTFAAFAGLQRLWAGEPYREADPRAEVTRIQDTARRAHDLMALPEAARLDHEEIDTGDCYYRGMEYWAHFDESQPGVNSFHTAWAAEPVTRTDARTALTRLRERLIADGWKVRDDRSGQDFLTLRLERPGTEDTLVADWYGTRSPVRLAVYTECVRKRPTVSP